MKQPEIVVFDIGGVLLDWDPRHMYAKIFGDRVEEMEWFLANVCTPEWNLSHDAGRDWEEGALAAIKDHPAHEANIRAYRQRWPEMVAGSIGETVTILEDLLEGGVPVYAITNFAGDTFRLVQETYPFLTRFRDVVVSGDEKMLKPEKPIYDLLASRNNLEHGSMVFIDDAEKNIVGAREAGLHGLHFTSPGKLRRDLVDLGFDVLSA